MSHFNGCHILGDNHPCQVILSGEKVTLEKILDCLQNGSGEVVLEESLRQRAMLPIRRMLDI